MKYTIRLLFAAILAGLLLALPFAQPLFAAELSETDTTDTAETIELSDVTASGDDITLGTDPDDNSPEEPILIEDCTITLSNDTYTYSGKEKKPSVTVTFQSDKLKKHKDYEIAYDDNIEIGTATVTVTGINRFSGSVVMTYTIRPKKVSSLLASVTGRTISISFKKVSNADGYVLYRRVKGTSKWIKLKGYSTTAKRTYTDSDCSFGEVYEYAVRTYKKTSGKNVYSEYVTTECAYRAAAPEVTQLMALSKTSFSIKWNPVDGADGYIIYRKVDGKWKKIKTIAANETYHYTIKKLTYKKTYTFAVRAYWKAEDGSICRGSLSDPIKEKLSFSYSYKDGYRLYYDASGDLITDVRGIIGSQNSYTIRVNNETNTVTVYAADPDKTDCLIPVTSFRCSTGSATPRSGTYKTSDKYRWHALIHNVYGQWCTRITGSILFHSVYYNKNLSADSLDVVEFNKLGTAASAGCIRLNCADVKWIYDNCSAKTEVTFYSAADPGPLGTPEALILTEDHVWDPTDPEMKKKCAELGCHME